MIRNRTTLQARDKLVGKLPVTANCYAALAEAHRPTHQGMPEVRTR
jgi:hypothetical protein